MFIDVRGWPPIYVPVWEGMPYFLIAAAWHETTDHNLSPCRAALSTFDMTRYVQIWKCLKVAAWSLKVAVKLQAQVYSDPTHHPSLLYPLRIFETHLHPTGLGLLAEMISLTRPSGGSHVDPTLTSISGGSKCLWSDDVGLCWPHHFDACEPLWALGSQSISMAAWREHQNGISL